MQTVGGEAGGRRALREGCAILCVRYSEQPGLCRCVAEPAQSRNGPWMTHLRNLLAIHLGPTCGGTKSQQRLRGPRDTCGAQLLWQSDVANAQRDEFTRAQKPAKLNDDSSRTPWKAASNQMGGESYNEHKQHRGLMLGGEVTQPTLYACARERNPVFHAWKEEDDRGERRCEHRPRDRPAVRVLHQDCVYVVGRA